MVASLMCYFLRDALQQLFYDPVWVRHMQHGREHARYWKSPEGQRVRAVLIRLGYDVDKVRNRLCSPRKCAHVCVRARTYMSACIVANARAVDIAHPWTAAVRHRLYAHAVMGLVRADSRA